MNKKIPVFILLTLTTFSFVACKKHNAPPACGCEAPARDTIPETSNIIGTIMYNEDISSKDFKDKYVILYQEENCINCKHYLAICNEAALPSAVLALKASKGSLQVSFSGFLKPICDKFNAPADYTYENLYLTKIKIQ
ncbi:hypothetical protein [Chitinophaga sp. Cy-1792]|uniref:hypothetical protein n=1 Tax=Chitinophaga sp. Cy-1792 TaxID=2608339 RepID=UPI00141EEE5F|nr:hypothetical protein [Chitinophaga sp. Cy-1792]NIG54477.1 hypothetical protein [Chitinophaga sp. Cy-1792]